MNPVQTAEDIRPWEAIFASQAPAALLPASLRQSAFAEFARHGIPSTKHEEWKYTPVRDRASKERAHAPAAAQGPDLARILQALPDIPLNRIVLIDGQLAPSLSQWLDTDGIQLDVPAPGQWDSPSLSQAPESPFVALNTALATGGFRLRIARGKAIAHPIAIVHVTTRPGDTAQHTRCSTTLGDGAQAQLFETHIHLGGDTFLNAVHEISIGQDAILRHDVLQNAPGMQQVAFTSVAQGARSQYHSFVLSTEGQLLRNNLHARHEGSHCETHMLGLYLAGGDTLVDNHTLVDHALPDCHSNELYKGVLGGKATAVFNGKILVRPHAQKTNAFQSNRTVLLSPGARVNTKPQLEIFADDVKCSHGATTGRLDEQALFYLRSRGLSHHDAMSLLTFAFAAEVLEKLGSDPLRPHLHQVVQDKLASLTHLA